MNDSENSEPNHVFILRNPKAGASSSRAKVEELVRGLVDDGWDVTLFEDPSELKSATQQALESGDLRVVVSAGGDGTLGLAANTLPVETPLTVFPFGTENLLAKNYRVRQNVNQMRSIIAKGN
ncbi:MAG: acylglycerol kinase family protein, partial [Planctomycetota bacterium]